MLDEGKSRGLVTPGADRAGMVGKEGRAVNWVRGLALLALLGGSVPAWGQLIVVPPPVSRTVVFGPSIGFDYHRRHLRITGFWGNAYIVESYGVPVLGVPVWGVAPWGVSTAQVTINYYLPRPIILAPAREPDLSGVDLDVMPPPWRPQAQQAARGAGPVAPAAPPAARPAPALPPPDLPAPPPLPADPQLAAALLLQEGKDNFRAQDYGLAAQRFRQAARLDPKNARARFYLAQALMAQQKYAAAVAAIQEGLDLDPQWPRRPFRPRFDLYRGLEAVYTHHLQQLQQTLAQHPEEPTLLFLWAYQLWFDDRQAEARPWFQKARQRVADTTHIDLFLNVPAGRAVATR
jgi:hypothetical protein